MAQESDVQLRWGMLYNSNAGAAKINFENRIE